MNWREMYPHYEKGWLETTGLIARPEKEVKKILETALVLGRDEVGARWLLRAVLYQYCGQTWGESLWFAEDSDDLFPADEIIKEMKLLAKKGLAHIYDDLMESVQRMVIFDPGDYPLYLIMADDLLGGEALTEIRKTLNKMGIEMTDEEWEGMLSEARPYYQEVVEKLACQWSDTTLGLAYMFNAQALAELDRVGDPVEASDNPSSGARRTNVEFDVMNALREIFARGLVAEGKDWVMPNGYVLTYVHASQLWEEVNE